jgi:isopentenyl-diphosphate Delta-isomerase
MVHNPPIQIVDDNDSPIDEATIQDAYDQGRLHRVVYVIVEDESGNILLQKRGPEIVNYPNRWDISAAGHVDTGESYEAAAKREMREELGLKDHLDLKKLPISAAMKSIMVACYIALIKSIKLS